MAVGLLGLVPAALVAPSVVVNYSLAVLVPLHGHWWVVECKISAGALHGHWWVVECKISAGAPARTLVGGRV